jgi:hypothetical protein
MVRFLCGASRSGGRFYPNGFFIQNSYKISGATDGACDGKLGLKNIV